jgi:beta-glucosidase
MPTERRVSDLLRRMSDEDKLALIRGAANERLGIPARTAVQGAMGISAKDPSGHPIVATAFPANIGISATWNPALAGQIGAVIGQQARALGRGQILGPLADIAHSPLSGRVFETYGENPWLASRIADGYIDGVQGEGEIATAIFTGGASDQRSARESDLRLVEAAVTEAGVWSVMPHHDEPPGSLVFLKNELGFRGFTVGSDRATDDQVRGILRAMFSSGVFERVAKVETTIETPAHRAVGRTAATESIVLLKNENGLLPLDRNKIHSLAIFGPNAAVNRMAGGNYTVAARYSEPPLDALRAVWGKGAVTAATSPADAARADAAIVFVGTGAATEGETSDRSSQALPAEQEDLIAAVAKANPRTIVVIIAGFPIAMDKWLTGVPAVLDAWFPGEEGGHAITDVLTGAVNPSGRLPIAFPDFPFGFGLSYAKFEYSDLAVLPEETPPGQIFEVSVTVANTGSRAGKETVQLYLHAIRSATSVKRADQDLRAFQQVELKPGESTRVSFTMNGDTTAYFDETRQQWVQDQAVFEVRVGSSSRDIRATGSLTITE